MNLKLNVQDRSAVVSAAFSIQLIIIGCMFAYSAMFAHLEAEFSWSREFLSRCSSIAFLVMGLLAIPAGKLSDRFGPRGVLRFSSVCFGFCFIMMGQMTEQWHLLVLFGLFAGIGFATHDVVTLSTVAKWYKHKMGAITGIVKVGTACGQILLPLLTIWLISAWGWRTAVTVLGIGATLGLLIAAQYMKQPPPAQKSDDDSRPASNDQPVGVSGGAAFKTIARTRQFWTMCVMQFTFFSSLLSVQVHIAVHGADLGLSTERAAALLSVIGAASIIGRLTLGPAVDRTGGKRAYLICFGILLTSLLLLRQIEDPIYLFLFTAIYGISHGGFFTIVSPTVAEYFGMKSHGVAFGSILFFGTLGGAMGPLLAGRVFDQTGSYNWAFNALIALCGLGFILALSMRPSPLRAKTS